MDLTFTDWSLVAIFLGLVLYKLGTWNSGYFTSKGIKSKNKIPFFGVMAGVIFRLKSFAGLVEEAYKSSEDRMVGIFVFHNPLLVLRDPELIKQITVKDFDYFTDHLQTVPETIDSFFNKNLFSLKGEKWRTMRATLSPAFTTSKMKNMFKLMNECGKQLEEYLQGEVDKQPPGEPYSLEMKDLFTRFANDVIATSAFGLGTDSLKEKDNAFYRMGKNITDFTGKRSLKLMGFILFPKLMEWLRVDIFSKAEESFFVDLIHDTIAVREKQGIVRPDMIHLLMQARKGELKADEGEEEFLNNKTKTTLTEGDIAAQAMIFFFAGFDTVSTLLSFTSMLLAANPDTQRKLQEEIDEAVAHDPNLSYEKVQSMQYLDMVLSESLRIFPPAPAVDRVCVKNYTIPASDKHPSYTICKGDGVWVPAYGIHHDPQYYPDPEKFDPERFSEENKHNIKPYTYLPFGVGPRLCIGQRFALLEAKVALVHILSRFNLVVTKKTPLPLRLSASGFVMTMKGGFWIGMTTRKK